MGNNYHPPSRGGGTAKPINIEVKDGQLYIEWLLADGSTIISNTAFTMENMDKYKGYLSEDAMNDLDTSSFEGGEFCFMASPNTEVSLYNWNPQSKKMVKNATANSVTEYELNSGIIIKSYMTKNPQKNDSRFKINKSQVDYQIYNGTQWKTITSIGSTIQDTLNLINNEDNSVIGINDIVDNKYNNIFRRHEKFDEFDTQTLLNEFGSFNRNSTISISTNDGLSISYIIDRANVSVQNNNDNVMGKGTYHINVTSDYTIELLTALMYINERTRARLVICDTKSDIPVYESQTIRESMDTNGIFLQNSNGTFYGNINVELIKSGFLEKGRTYTITLEILEGSVSGNGIFPYMALFGTEHKQEVIATREWIENRTSDRINKLTLIDKFPSIVVEDMQSKMNMNVVGVNSDVGTLEFGNIFSQLNIDSNENIKNNKFHPLHDIMVEEPSNVSLTGSVWSKEFITPKYMHDGHMKKAMIFLFKTTISGDIHMKIESFPTIGDLGQVIFDKDISMTHLGNTSELNALYIADNDNIIFESKRTYKMTVSLIDSQPDFYIFGDEFPSCLISVYEKIETSLIDRDILDNITHTFTNKTAFTDFEENTIYQFDVNKQEVYDILTIPSSMHGQPVNKIFNNVFTNLGDRTVYIPESVIDIGDGNFNTDNIKCKIMGRTGSYADQYAKNNGLEFISDGRLPKDNLFKSIMMDKHTSINMMKDDVYTMGIARQNGLSESGIGFGDFKNIPSLYSRRKQVNLHYPSDIIERKILNQYSDTTNHLDNRISEFSINIPDYLGGNIIDSIGYTALGTNETFVYTISLVDSNGDVQYKTDYIDGKSGFNEIDSKIFVDNMLSGMILKFDFSTPTIIRTYQPTDKDERLVTVFLDYSTPIKDRLALDSNVVKNPMDLSMGENLKVIRSADDTSKVVYFNDINFRVIGARVPYTKPELINNKLDMKNINCGKFERNGISDYPNIEISFDKSVILHNNASVYSVKIAYLDNIGADITGLNAVWKNQSDVSCQINRDGHYIEFSNVKITDITENIFKFYSPTWFKNIVFDYMEIKEMDIIDLFIDKRKINPILLDADYVVKTTIEEGYMIREYQSGWVEIYDTINVSGTDSKKITLPFTLYPHYNVELTILSTTSDGAGCDSVYLSNRTDTAFTIISDYTKNSVKTGVMYKVTGQKK